MIVVAIVSAAASVVAWLAFRSIHDVAAALAAARFTETARGAELTHARRFAVSRFFRAHLSGGAALLIAFIGGWCAGSLS